MIAKLAVNEVEVEDSASSIAGVWATLFNGEYYCQSIDPDTDIRYQYAQGCIVTQLIGQWQAKMLGLGYLLDPDNVKTALAQVFEHNFHDGFSEMVNPGNALTSPYPTVAMVMMVI